MTLDHKKVGVYLTILTGLTLIVFVTALVHASKMERDHSEIIAVLEGKIETDTTILQNIFGGHYERENVKFTAVSVSSYSSRPAETDNTPYETASGNSVFTGIAAVSRDLINAGVKFGDIIYLEGIGLFRVEDVMAKRWERRVDLWCGDTRACKLFGTRQNVKMLWIKREVETDDTQ